VDPNRLEVVGEQGPAHELKAGDTALPYYHSDQGMDSVVDPRVVLYGYNGSWGRGSFGPHSAP
jgi:hypothetical protein